MTDSQKSILMIMKSNYKNNKDSCENISCITCEKEFNGCYIDLFNTDKDFFNALLDK